MKLYRSRVPTIARAVIGRLVQDGDIEVAPESREEAERDVVAIFEEFLRRDDEIREAVRDVMARNNIPYDQYGKIRGQVAESRGHAVADDVDRYLARQVVENCMVSRFVSEVFADDKDMYKKVLDTLKANDVDERQLRAEAEGLIKNIPEGSVNYQDALQRAMRDVRKRHGLF